MELMYIGIDIGGSKILVVASDDARRIVRSQKIETPDTAAQGVMEIIHLVESIAGSAPIKSIFISSPGPVDRKRGMILKTPNMGWTPVRIVEQLQNHFHVPVGLEKDANSAALSEALIGAGARKPYVLYVTISTGVGTGMVIDGQIYHGAHDPEGGHSDILAEGHIETMERAVSGKAIKRRTGLYGYEITDEAMWDLIAKDMAIGLHNLITIWSPSVVVMGGGVNVHFAKFERFLRAHLAELNPIYPTPPIVPAKNMETAVAYGSLILAERLVHAAKTTSPLSR